MEAYDAAVQEGRTNPCAYVQSLGLKGFYRSCIYKWKKTRQQDSWTVMRAASPRLAKKYRELPDVLRNLLGKQRKFIQRASNASGSATCILPAAFQDMVASAVATGLNTFGGRFAGTVDGHEHKYIYIIIYIFIYFYYIDTHTCTCQIFPRASSIQQEVILSSFDLENRGHSFLSFAH